MCFIQLGAPFLLILFVVVYAVVSWGAAYQEHKELINNTKDDKEPKSESEEERLTSIRFHNERIYKDFDFFLTVILAIAGALGYLGVSLDASGPSKIKAMQGLGAFGLLVSFAFSFFIICHQSSKIRRWKKSFSWHDVFFWEEFWMIVVMLFASTGVWIVAWTW